MSNKASIGILVAIALIAGLVGFGIGKMGGSSSGGDEAIDVSRSFIQKLATSDIDGTYEHVSEAFQARNGKDYIESIAKQVQTDDLKISDEEAFIGSGATKDDAIYLGTAANLPEKDGDTDGSFIIRLVKESGTWKIDSAQIY